MLTAAAYGKLKRNILFWEDEITSCVFGAMQYLPAHTVWEIFRRMANEARIAEQRPGVEPDTVDFIFWPQWQTGSGYVEPDLVVQFHKEKRTLVNFIVEVKWGSLLSPPCELVRQWRHRQPRAGEDWYHLYVVRDTARGLTEVENSLRIDESSCPEECTLCRSRNIKEKVFKGESDRAQTLAKRIGCVGWRHIVSIARAVHLGSGMWAEGVQAFFAKLGIVPFIGFHWLEDNNCEVLMNDAAPFFQTDAWFEFLKAIDLKCKTSEMTFFRIPE